MFNTLILFKMKATCIRTYRSSNGNPTFVYTVAGSTEELAKFKEIQGSYYREDENANPLWFTTRYCGEQVDLLVTSNGKLAPDMTEYDKQASLVSQYGGNFGDQLAKQGIDKLKGNSSAE